MNKNIKINAGWYKKDIKNSHQYKRDLFSKEILVIQSSLKNIGAYNSFKLNSPKNKNLAKLTNLFDEILNAVVDDQYGFIILSKFPVNDNLCSMQLIRKFFFEFSRYLGLPIIQNKNKDLIFDVQYINSSHNDPNARGPQVNDALPLHADHGGLLGMYCLNSAKTGGHTLLASTHTVHYEIEQSRPDLLDVLYKPFYGDRRGHEPSGALPYDYNPIFCIKENKLLCQYAGYYLDDTTEKFPDLPPLSEKQKEAIDFFCQITSKNDIQFEIKLDPGDVIFINNNKVLHGRTAFNEDGPTQDIKRHLLRIWLSTPQIKSFPHYYGYPIPDSFAMEWP